MSIVLVDMISEIGPSSMMKFLKRLLGDEEIAKLLGSEKDIEAMVRFELALLHAHNVHGLLSRANFEAISNHLTVFRLDDHSLLEATLRDGAVVPDLVRQMRAHLPEELRSFLHFGVSSQDVIDTAFSIKMGPVFRILEERLANVLAGVDDLIGRFGGNHFSKKASAPNQVSNSVLDRLLVWRGPLDRAFETLFLEESAVRILALEYGRGIPEKLSAQTDNVKYMIAEELGLTVPDYQPHSQRDRLVNFASWLSLVAGALGNIGQDVNRLMQYGGSEISFAEQNLKNSETVSKKSSRAEILVTLAKFNAVAVSGMHQSMFHSQEQSSSAWALEWMIMPQMIETTATALSHAVSLLQTIEKIGSIPLQK